MEISRYDMVDTLYGPGTVSAWLLTFCAVLVDSTMHAINRRKDTFTLDFIAVLLLPSVAAGHLIYQIIRLPVPLEAALISGDPDIQQYVAALEAPLNICETFSFASLILAICGSWIDLYTKKKRRLIAVILTGLFCWSTENILFAMATLKGVDTAHAQLSRPYLFLITPIIGSVWAFIVILVVVLTMQWMISSTFDLTSSWPTQNLESCNDNQYSSSLVGARMDRITEMMATGMSKTQAAGKFRSDLQFTRSMWVSGGLSAVFLPISVLMTVLCFSLAEPPMIPPENPNTFFLIPLSKSSLRDLDQIMALVGGILVFLAATISAYLSRNRSAARSVPKRRQSL